MGFYGLSNGARNNFRALPIFEKQDIEGGGGGGGGDCHNVEQASTSFPEYVKIFSWYQIHGLFRDATNDHTQTSPQKLSTL